jgi:lysine decarboxylase/arginine decarboxylase
MESRTVSQLAHKVLIINDQLESQTAVGRACRAIVKELDDRGIDILLALSNEDARAIVLSEPSLSAILVDWGMVHKANVFDAFRKRNANVPVFLTLDRDQETAIPLQIMQDVNEIIFLLEDTGPFIAGRVQAACQRYVNEIAPPMFQSLVRFNNVHEYSWHTPGHTGGTAFLKTMVGKTFFEYFGENLFRSDLSISVGELGSLLDHSGPIGESEKYISRIFGSHRSYTVTNGSSTSNRMIYMASITAGDIAFCDRNCHKSVEQAMTISGAVPTYLVPLRNYLGIIGPIPPSRLREKALKKLIDDSPLTKNTASDRALHATITNSTYDGVCYNAKTVVQLLNKSVDRIHFDEAWYGYARFNKMYHDRYGMFGDSKDYPADAPTVFTTQSTHKLLAALSQASYIHVRDGRNPIEHNRFNEAFMMNSSTSPLYTIIASNEVAAAMMDEAGDYLTTESIREAVDFRQIVMRYSRDFAKKGTWFFTTWNADTVRDKKGKSHTFADAPAELLTTEPDCWVMHPGQSWHGYKDLESDYALLDPIKVSVVCPGVNRDGSMAINGIPAALLVSYLGERGIVNEKTTDFTVLFLFSVGITKGKWGTLLNAMLAFKDDYDKNAPLTETLPSLVKKYPHYQGMGLKDLSDTMFAHVKSSGQTALQSDAFSNLPHPDMMPQKAYQELVHNNVEQIPLSKLAGRTLATGIVPYPPGIPLMMPGENAGPDNGPLIGYLKALREFDKNFPGFTHDTHGVENIQGEYHVYVVKQKGGVK